MPLPESSSENPWSILWTSVELSPRTTELRTAVQKREQKLDAQGQVREHDQLET